MPGTGTERGLYIEAGTERLYTITFACETPVAQVLLCGPFPSERLYSLGAWVRWARFLASNNVLVVRFDYRGTSESTGKFTEMDFHRWQEDIFTMCEWTAANCGGGPLVLHGLGMGGLLAQKVFASQRADALLMWSPPLDTREVLKQGLIARLAMDMALQKPGERKSAQEYFDNLNTGGQIEVDGLTWSSGLWKSSENMALDAQYALAGEGSERMDGRPWSHVLLGSDVAPLVRSSTLLRAMNPRAAVVPPFPLNPDLSAFFTKNLNWILDNVAQPKRNVHA